MARFPYFSRNQSAFPRATNFAYSALMLHRSASKVGRAVGGLCRRQQGIFIPCTPQIALNQRFNFFNLGQVEKVLNFWPPKTVLSVWNRGNWTAQKFEKFQHENRSSQPRLMSFLVLKFLLKFVLYIKFECRECKPPFTSPNKVKTTFSFSVSNC